jgi:hypothetical protein
VVEADWAKIVITTENDADDMKSISDKRKEDRRAVVRILESRGFQKDTIEKEPPLIRDNRANDSDKSKGVKRFRISDGFSIRSEDMKLVRKIISEIASLLDEGVCISWRIEYYVKNIEDVKAALIDEATKDVIKKAGHIAKASGKRITRDKKLKVDRISICQADSSSESIDCGMWNEKESQKKDIRVSVKGKFSAKPI